MNEEKTVGTRSVRLGLPEEIIALFGSAEGAAAKAKEALVFDLLREARIGQGMAAEVLGMTREAILDQMTLRRIASGPETAEEASREIEELRRYFAARASDGGN